ncbi:MAG TPA: hypothetical protein VJ247_00425 [Gaiella sp.]|nr:hypothetical protein [Gaiella sp.]
MSTEPPSDRQPDRDLQARLWLLAGIAAAGLGALATCGCVLPLVALGVVVILTAHAYGDDTPALVLLLATAVIVALVLGFARLRR